MKDVSLAYLLVDSSLSVTDEMESVLETIDDVGNDVIDFGTITYGLTDAQVAAYPTLNMYPFVVSAIAPVYRLDAFSASGVQLVLSREALAGIAIGAITWWNDSAIQQTNQAVTMPAQRITVAYYNESLALVRATHTAGRSVHLFVAVCSLAHTTVPLSLIVRLLSRTVYSTSPSASSLSSTRPPVRRYQPPPVLS